MPEQLIDTRFPGQQFPVGSVVTLLDRHRRTVFPAVTELRRHEAIVGGGETGRWRVRYARPSGDPTPSGDDVALTARLCEAGTIMGIDVLDHMILAESRQCSFKEMGRL